MIDQGIYTRGKSFRAIAEAQARNYRYSVLGIEAFDRYGHILTDRHAEMGMNFLPSMRKEILNAVYERHAAGKGVDLKRTRKNMLASQALCFNLFVPLNRDLDLAAAFFRHLLGNVAAIDREIEYEYTPDKAIFNDQSGRGGVDCDALLTYTNKENQKVLVAIETKYVEPKFSNCGFRRGQKNDKCPKETKISPDFSTCRYHYKKHYNYWEVAEESKLFKMDKIYQNPCPFGGNLWQLWTNMSLAYGLSRTLGIPEFRYLVICPQGNSQLSGGGAVFNEFSSLLTDPSLFKVIFLEEIRDAFEKLEDSFPENLWTKEFIERYCN